MSENAGKNLLGAQAQFVVATGKRKLTLTNRAAYQLEQRYGSFQAYLERMRNGAYMETISVLFVLGWEIDEDEALDLIVGSEFKSYFEAIANLIATFLGAKVTVEEAPASGEGDPGPDRSPGIVSMASRSSRAGSIRSASGR